MTTTDYLGLKKPDPQDYYNVEDWNDNSDTLDQFAEGLAGDSGVLQQMQAAITAKANTADVTAAQTKTDTALAELIDSGPKNVANADENSQTVNQVTFTRVGDGTWTTSGTASARAAKMLPFYVSASLQAGRYILTGCPPGGKVGTTIKYCLYLMDITAGSRVTASNDDTGDGFAFDWTPDSTHQYAIMIDIRNGTNANGLTFKPMICLESAWKISNKFVKYAPSNAALYAMIQAMQ